MHTPRGAFLCGRWATLNFAPSRSVSGMPAHTAKWCNMIDAATVTFRDAVPGPCCGMYTKPSQHLICLADRPVPWQSSVSEGADACHGNAGLLVLPVSRSINAVFDSAACEDAEWCSLLMHRNAEHAACLPWMTVREAFEAYILAAIASPRCPA